MMSERIYGGSGLIYDVDTGKWVYAEYTYWDKVNKCYRACKLPPGEKVTTPHVPTAEEELAWCNGG